MDNEALYDWNRLQDEYDLGVQQLFASLGDAVDQGSPVLEHLADVRQRRDVARSRFHRSVDERPDHHMNRGSADTGAFVVLGRD